MEMRGRENVFCGSLNRLAELMGLAEMLCCKLLSNEVLIYCKAFFLCTFQSKSPMASRTITLFYGEQLSANARKLKFCYILFH
jgi:hypothetical protein